MSYALWTIRRSLCTSKIKDALSLLDLVLFKITGSAKPFSRAKTNSYEKVIN